MPDLGWDDHRSQAGALASRRSLAIWIWSALFIADAVLVTRRLSGEFASPLPAGLALLSTALVAIASLAAWRLFTHARRDDAVAQSRRWKSRGLSLAATILWAWSISAGASPQSAGLLFAVVAMLLLSLAGIDICEFSSPAPPVLVETPGAPGFTDDPCLMETPASEVSTPTVFDQSIEVELVETGDDSGEDADDDSLTLWLSRRQTEDGEQIEGWVRAHFAAGQRETTIHVAFCPPMSACPEIETEELDGAGLEIRVAAVFPFGVRLSVRRSGELDERNIDRIGFIAHALPVQRAA